MTVFLAPSLVSALLPKGVVEAPAHVLGEFGTVGSPCGAPHASPTPGWHRGGHPGAWRAKFVMGIADEGLLVQCGWHCGGGCYWISWEHRHEPLTHLGDWKIMKCFQEYVTLDLQDP